MLELPSYLCQLLIHTFHLALFVTDIASVYFKYVPLTNDVM